MSGIQQMFFFVGSNKSNWIGLLGSTGVQEGRGVVADSSNNVYIVGLDSVGGGIELVMYDSTGVIQWQNLVPLADATGIAIDNSANLYCCGYNSTPADAQLIKYNSSGTIQWQRTLGTTGSVQNGKAVAVDSSGNAYILFSDVSTDSRGDFALAKYNTSGTLQWQRKLSNAYTDSPIGISVDSSSNVYITGASQSSLGGITDVLLAKYNTSGTLQWQNLIGDGVNSSTGRGVTTDSSGNVYVTGTVTGTQAIQVMKMNSSGAVQWQRALSGGNPDGYSVYLDSSANVYVLGYSSSINGFELIKYNSSGAIQWQRQLYCSGVNSTGFSVFISFNGNVLVTGHTSASGNKDFLFASLPADGSKTGTYTVGAYSFTYSASTLTDAAGGLTSSTSTLTASTPAFTSATTTLTASTSTLTSTVTTI
jgi:outer membrane protein assembly factor BamB